MLDSMDINILYDIVGCFCGYLVGIHGVFTRSYGFCGYRFIMCRGQNLGSLKAQASSKRGGRAGVALHQLSHGVNFWAILPNDEVPHSVACCVPMPLPSDLHLD